MCNLSDLVETRGEKQGETKKAREIALNMLGDGVPYETVSKYSGIPIETLKKWELEAACPV